MSERATDDELLRQYLAGRNVPCPKCGYDLRDLSGTKCPECGRPLRLGIEQGPPPITAWVVGLVAPAATAGLNGIVIAAEWRWGQYLESYNVHFYVGFGLSLLAPIAWIIAYRWHMRRSAFTKWFLAMTCWLLPILQTIVLFREM